MAHIEDLAVELMFLVFKHIYSYRRDIQDLRHPATFPFNVVWVCQSWRQMLMGSPEYWTHIAFDVSNDPTPLLDAFAWSTDLKISVLVFTTANDLTDEGKMQENCRVASIVTHLQPHIERCTSIVFDITFASSLPSPTIFLAREVPDLKDLTLEYQVHDLADVADNTKGARVEHSPMSARFPQLNKLSLSGLAFMDILHLGDDWLTTVKATRSPHITLYISDIQFQTTMRRNPESADSNSIFDFLRLISALSPPYGIHFKNLSLSYRPHGRRQRDAEHLHEILTTSLSFDNVSPDVLIEFFQLAKWSSGSTAFSRCSIPRLSGNLSPSYNLTFKHVPPSDTSVQDDSLCNILSIWSGDGRDALSVTSCDAFNDEFLRWLGEKGEDGKINTKGIKAFLINDCTNFTAGVLLDLIDFLSTPDMQEQEGRENRGRLQFVAVSGRSPVLTDDDMEWVRQCGMRILWSVKTADGQPAVIKQYKRFTPLRNYRE